jgi:glycosyltransferase involved in cell wall biosynthesis
MEGGASEAPELERRAREVQALRDSGIFDAAWYATHNADVGHAGLDPVEHYLDRGWRERRAPNFYLDPAWYEKHHADVRGAGFDPVLHYLLHGDREGRAPGPHFDIAWYRARHALDGATGALAHYLRARHHGASPIPDFDAEFYLSTYRDVARAGADPYEHYVTLGWQEGREPHPEFDSRYYVKRHMGGHAAEPPLLHWLRHRHEPGVHPRMPQETPTIPRQLRRNTRPGEEFELPRALPEGAKPRAMVWAYYLPQFHAIAENDRWWGTGFTEWTNLPRALPRFVGHYQPRVPRDLGHYNLGGPDAGREVMRRQIEMAKGGGVGGFVFYWYWFNGHRLLEKPVEAFLQDRSLDMPFALMWANENWTRRWDGAENDVLMSQDYRAEEEEALIDELARHFADPRYIRLSGRPVVMMYRAGLVPEPKRAVAAWRQRFRERHGEDPIFVMAQSFDDTDPREVGFDGAIEFPPHKLAKRATPISASLDYLDPDFTGTVFAFEDVVRASLDEPEPDYPLVKCVVPGWDNDPRKQGSGTVIIHGAKPASYEAWLAELVERAERRPFFGEPVVCVNAWNEWCEGAYLEPDLHYGAAFLNATARAVVGRPAADAPALLVAAEDGSDTEAARRLIAAVRAMRRRTGLPVEVLLLDGGPLEDEYARLGRLTVATPGADAEAALAALRADGVRHALMTLGAAGPLAAAAAQHGIGTTVLLAEMPGEVRARDLAGGLRALRHAGAAVAPSAAVAAALRAEFALPATPAIEVMEPGLPAPPAPDAAARQAQRAALALDDDEPLLLGGGPGDIRHGVDLFLHLFRRLRGRVPGLRAIWAGGLDPALRAWMAPELAAATRLGFRLIEQYDSPATLFDAADLFALTAREAALPAVLQAAISAGLPCLAFEGAGGGAALAAEFGGAAVPLGDLDAMVEAALRLLAAETGKGGAGRAERHAAAAPRFDMVAHADALLARLLPELPAVSVAVPGAGQGRLLAVRLDGVFRQDLAVREVVLLDDATDPRVADGAAEAAARWEREIATRPGPARADAAKAAAAALAATAGEFLWIAESTVLPGSGFLRRAVAALRAAPRAGCAHAAGGTAADAAPAGWGAVLWRRTMLQALVEADAGADLAAMCRTAGSVALPEVPVLRLAPPPRPRARRIPAPLPPEPVAPAAPKPADAAGAAAPPPPARQKPPRPR